MTSRRTSGEGQANFDPGDGKGGEGRGGEVRSRREGGGGLMVHWSWCIQ